jgi:hypothetical protein
VMSRRERGIAALAGLAGLLVVFSLTAEFFTPGKPEASNLYQLVLITFAGNWSPAGGVAPVWNALTAWLAVLLNLGPLIALLKIAQYVSDQKEKNMNTLALIDVLGDLVEVRVAKDLAAEFRVEDEAARGKLLDIVSKAVRETRVGWSKATVSRILGAEKAAEFREQLLKEL